MSEQSGEKSFDATPHRRQKAREQGQVPYSQDLGSAILLLAGAGLLYTFQENIAESMQRVTRRLLTEPLDMVADANNASATLLGLASEMAIALAPVIGLLLLAAVATSIGQVGFLFVPDKLAPDISRISPLKGFGRLFSMQGVMKLGFGLFKVAVVAAATIMAVTPRISGVLEAARLGSPQLIGLIVDTAFATVFAAGLALLILALADLFFQRWKHEQDLKMTAQEMKEEMKNLQGDPEIAARRRQVQRQMAQARISGAVPKADVVVTNPTELAVALQYDPDTMAAPVVVAKGAGVLAQRIRRLALENNVPIVERKPLAQLLYKEVDIGRAVPTDSYAAVAEVLAYVYQLKGKKPPKPPQAAA
ncbi:flagellar biosynthesis protein FlhB [Botrimarina mediterranea]|uniref:Flagellar biosynthetic protein FlhB n=1 Tax=Botrimarina mediterranea TaxID=2528022 RepID=A0A518KBU6_9BACT|nr:flagellar biosynthesis protein FlhB [Botrimarina mediterranea]QDV75264.1 Flagellar biosynthetic protein FlhB [Botrimarina mediterranea]QDV79933.1 Flagellar biosynthetic protein FlhB [Planctomycetes bacterium K2D]